MVATTKRHPVDRAASHRRDARRPPHRDGHRRRARRRRVLHAQPGRALARRAARDRARIAARHVRIRGRAMRTNTPPNGAFRGFGAPQTQFGVEVHMDRIAETLGIDPVRLREMNALRPGDTTATGQVLGDDASALPVLREAVRRSGFARKRRSAGRGSNRGIGLSLFFHGSGFTGGGEVKLASKASLELTPTRRAHPRRVDRDRSGHADDARADRRRHARHPVRRGRGARRRHRRTCPTAARPSRRARA